jgi:ABC-type sugar transport system permease subunit
MQNVCVQQRKNKGDYLSFTIKKQTERKKFMAYEIAVAVILLALAFTAIYIVWWMNKQEREEERNKLLP